MALKVWLPLNGSLENKGISDVNLTSTAFTIENNGKIGECIKTTSSSSIDLGYNGNQINTGDLSFGGWFKINEEDITSIINSGNYTSTNKVATSNLMGNDSYGGIGLIWETNNIYGSTFSSMNIFGTLRTGTVNQSTASIVVPFNQWIHLFLTFQKSTGTLSFYKNGVLIGSKVFSNFTDAVSRNLMLNYKAVYGGNAVSFNLPYYVNDIRIYDNCLSQKEVKEISQGLVLHYKLNGLAGGVGENLIPSGGLYTKTNPWTTTLSRTDGYAWVTGSAFEGKPSTTYTISVECDGTLNDRHGSLGNLTVSDKPWTFWLYICNTDTTKSWSTGSYDAAVNLTSVNNNYRKIGNTHVWTYTLSSTQKYISLRTNSYSDGTTNVTVNWWNMKIEEGDIFSAYTPPLTKLGIDTTKVIDSSGYENNGIIINSISIEKNSPKYNYATHIDNTSSKIKIDNLQTSGFGNSYTFAWWAKISSVTPMHWGFSNGIRLNGLYTGRLWNTGDGSNNPLYNPGTTTQVTAPSVNVWHHWAMVGNGTKCLVYQDGQLWAEAKTYKAISGTTIYINGWDTSTSYSSNNYSISDFRIYATALSAEDIAELYHTPANIDNLNNLHGFELIEEDKKDSIYKNGIISTGDNKNYLVNNFSKTNTLTDWTFTSPTISNGIVTTTGTAPTINSKTFTVNPDDIVVVKFTLSMPTPSTSTSGQGLYLGTQANANTNRYNFNFTTKTWGAAQSNASSSWNTYFLNGYNSTNMVTIQSYILGSNVNINDVPAAYCSLSSISSTNAIQLTSGTTTYIRAGYNSGNTTMVIRLNDFQIYNLKEHGIVEENNSAKTGLGYLQYQNFIEK